MKTSLLLLIVFIFALQLKATPQEVSYYYCGNFNETTDAVVIMYPNQCFVFFTEQKFTDDVIYNLLFSYGKYSIKEDTIVLTDSIDQYVIKFLDCGSYIVPVRPMLLYKNKKFIKSPYFNNYPYDLFQDERKIRNILLQKELKICNHDYSNLEGTYFLRRYTDAINYKLKLYTEGAYKKYELWYNNRIISSGQWFNNWNRVGLYDPVIKHTFYFMSSEGGLTNLTFPPVPETYRGLWRKK